MEQPLSPAKWTVTQRLLFRFSFAFFLLYIFFNPNGVLPGTDPLFNIYIQPFHRLIPWIGLHILHLSQPITVFTNGSGDTTYDNLILLFLCLVAILTCLIWSAADRKRASYTILFYWLTTIVRYYLAITMLTYGFVKVFKLQFPYPGLYRLTEPYGDSSPMGLAWAFMGYSQYRNPAKDSLVLWGSRLWGQQADSVLIALTHYPLSRFRLSSREFHWINEYPYNR